MTKEILTKEIAFRLELIALAEKLQDKVISLARETKDLPDIMRKKERVKLTDLYEDAEIYIEKNEAMVKKLRKKLRKIEG